MAKRIVVCSDGTGNNDIKGRGTNVFKLFEAVDLDSHRLDPSKTPQIAIYDDGVGTQTFIPLKIASGATGWGLSRNVKHLYKELARVYDPGDEIYMFGFSRGAFTVRTLAGFIATCGLIDQRKLDDKTFSGLKKAVARAYKAYRKCYRPLLQQLLTGPTRKGAERFRRDCSHDHDVKIRFLGVWDTVDAVGLPFYLSDFINVTLYRFKFPDQDLTDTVERACQALALDDDRESFRPLLWRQRPGDGDRIEQVWFGGAHSNVGGGYPKQGMSLVALDWMLSHAQRAGLPFNQDGLRLNGADRDSFRSHASVDDKLYDPRAGLGLFYRWSVRDIERLCGEHDVPVKVHVSVLERIAHGTDDYFPGNVPASAQVVITEPIDTNKAERLSVDRQASRLLLRRAANTQEILKTVRPSSLLDLVRFHMLVGKASYYLYLLAFVSAIAGVAALDNAFWSTLTAGVIPVSRIISSPLTSLHGVGTALWNQPWAVVALGELLMAYLLSLWVDSRLDHEFSTVWYSKQRELRDALKAARAEMGGDKKE